MTGNEAVISVRDLVVGFGGATVLDRVTLDVFRGEILGFVGGSGAGKSVLMRTIIGLLPKREGTIEVFGTDLAGLDGDERRAVERRWGVLFQQGALFSSLNVRQNVQFPMREHLDFYSLAELTEIVRRNCKKLKVRLASGGVESLTGTSIIWTSPLTICSNVLP